MKTQDIKNIAWAMQQVAEKLTGGQHKLDKDKDGDIDKKDFAMMRKKKNEETDQLDELSPATLGSYVNKVNHERDYVGYGKKRNQRQKGVKTAISKLVTKAGGQEVDKPIKHDCATHVEHAEWGEGQPISGMHTIVETAEGEGYVTHYDVMFEHGIEKDVSVDDLKIIAEMSHGHSVNASKKKKMAEDEVEINPSLKTKKEKKGTETTTQDMGEEVEQVDEISKKTLGSYIKKAGPDAVKQTAQAKRHSDAGDMADKDRDMYKAYGKSQRAMDKAKNRQKGISKAVDKLTASYKTESKNAALMKKLAKASAPSEKGKAAVTLKKAPFEIPKKEGVEWAVYNKIKENRAGHYKSATAPEEMDSKASGNEKDFKAKHKVDTMPADLEKKGHDDASAAGRVTKKAPARSGDNPAGDKIQTPVDTTK